MGLQRLVGRTPAATLFDVCLDNQQRTNSCFCWPFFGITIRTAGLISLITVNWWHSETIESIKRTKWRSVDKNVPCFCELQFHDTSWREIPLLKNDFRKNTFLLSFFTSLVNACVYYYFFIREKYLCDWTLLDCRPFWICPSANITKRTNDTCSNQRYLTIMWEKSELPGLVAKPLFYLFVILFNTKRKDFLFCTRIRSI